MEGPDVVRNSPRDHSSRLSTVYERGVRDPGVKARGGDPGVERGGGRLEEFDL